MSASTNVKAKAKRWANTILHTNHDEPIPGIPGPSRIAAVKPPQYVDPNLCQSFDSMSLAKDTKNPFVGGFNPALVPNHRPDDPKPTVVHPWPGPLPAPPKLSFPAPGKYGRHSKTMQYALRDQNGPPREELKNPPAPVQKQRVNFVEPHDLPDDSTKPTPRKNGASTRNSAQCAAFTKAGKRCTRQVKAATPSQGKNSGSESGMTPKYCFQHIKEINSATGFYARKNGLWIDYKSWIPDHLLPETQAALRAEMEKARSSNDTPGYIYTFEIREPSSATIKFKIGRATNHVRRLDQWGKQCGSKEQVRLGVYPEPIGGANSNLRGLQELDPTRKAAWCHRLERLIHLELADITTTKVYLDPAWPSPKIPRNKSKGAAHDRKTDDAFREKQPCTDCGCIHKEIFEFEKITKGRYKGKEYELIVKPVIEKWGGFVDDFV